MTDKEAIERIKDIFGENPEPCILETFIDENDVEAVSLAIKALEARHNGKWIDIKKRLPEADNDYLVAHLIIDNHYATDIGYFDGKEWYVGDFKTYEVIAWQRLPKPYMREAE